MILLLNQFYPPDAAPTGRLLADVARYLAESGHRITVVCGRSRYERPKAALATEAGPDPRVRVIRLPNLPFARSPAPRSFFSSVPTSGSSTGGVVRVSTTVGLRTQRL
jgi:hypothetical protein